MTTEAPFPLAPSIRRRLACAVYELLLLCAVWLVAAFPFTAFTQGLEPAWLRPLTQGYLWLITGVYFSVFWRRGQTLAMKTWRIRLESTATASTGTPPDWRQCWLRYVLACLNVLLLGLGWWLAAVRRDRQFLQDRLAGTRLVRVAS